MIATCQSDPAQERKGSAPASAWRFWKRHCAAPILPPGLHRLQREKRMKQQTHKRLAVHPVACPQFPGRRQAPPFAARGTGTSILAPIFCVLLIITCSLIDFFDSLMAAASATPYYRQLYDRLVHNCAQDDNSHRPVPTDLSRQEKTGSHPASAGLCRCRLAACYGQSFKNNRLFTDGKAAWIPAYPGMTVEGAAILWRGERRWRINSGERVRQ